jgi:hypothetical protein
MNQLQNLQLKDNRYEGTIHLPCWAGYHTIEHKDTNGIQQINMGELMAEKPHVISDADRNAIEYIAANSEHLQKIFLQKLLREYPKWQPKYGYSPEDALHFMPDVKSIDGFKHLLILNQIYIHPQTKDGVSYVGFEFECEWDVEHGIGCMFHKDRIVAFGMAESSFMDWIMQDDIMKDKSKIFFDYLDGHVAEVNAGKANFIVEKYSPTEIAEFICFRLSNLVANYDQQIFIDTTVYARDFYRSSNVNDKQAEEYISVLKAKEFFQILALFLNHHSYHARVNAIYNFGKFAFAENADYLEDAYTNYYYGNNPFIAARCLNELFALDSKKAPDFMEHLKKDNSLCNQLILIYVYERRSDRNEITALLKNKELAELLGIKSSDIKEINRRIAYVELYYEDLTIDFDMNVHTFEDCVNTIKTFK